MTGLSHFPEPACVAVAALVIAWLLRAEWYGPVGAALALGVLAGHSARLRDQSSCAARLAAGAHHLRVRAIDPGRGTGRVELVGLPCQGPVLARWFVGSRIEAGATATVQARWKPSSTTHLIDRATGVLHIDSARALRRNPSLADRLRNAITHADARLFGEQAPLADALIGGWRGELDPALRQQFAASGLMHLLSISGFHLAILAGWVLIVLRMLGVPRPTAGAMAAILAIGYTAVLGWPAAAARAAALIALHEFCRWRQRRVRPDALLGGSLLMVLLIQPWAVVDVGAALSVMGFAGVVLALRWTEVACPTTPGVRILLIPLGAVIATAPIAAAVFGQVAPIGVIATAIATPLLAGLLPALAAALLFNPLVSGVAHAFATAANALLYALQRWVQIAAALPGAAEPGATGWRGGWPWVAVLAAAVWITWRRTTVREALRRMAWCAVGAIWVTLLPTGLGGVPLTDGHLTLFFLDVGQGDAALIRTPHGHWIAIDAGPANDQWNAGRQVVSPALAHAGARRIDLQILSHAHRDHVGGATALVSRWSVGLAVEPGELFADSAYQAWLMALADHRDRWHAVRAGATWAIDGVDFAVLHPPVRWPRQGDDLNEDSIVLELEYRGFRALLMGDAGFVAESALAGRVPRVDLLKVGHHGSRTASSAAFLRAIGAKAAIVSVGPNGYGHPSAATLARLVAADLATWRTDLGGTVTVTVASDGGQFTVENARQRAVYTTRH